MAGDLGGHVSIFCIDKGHSRRVGAYKGDPPLINRLGEKAANKQKLRVLYYSYNRPVSRELGGWIVARTRRDGPSFLQERQNRAGFTLFQQGGGVKEQAHSSL